ncbi:MAG: hypothetical protein AAGD06_11075 [Acidobacteriota bacterium]
MVRLDDGTKGTGVERVVEVLVRRGRYRLMASPLRIDGVRFELDAVLEGPGRQRHTVLVADGAAPEAAGVPHRIRALALLLERAESARPLTLVWLDGDGKGRPPLEDLCRVVAVDPHRDDDDLAERLASLLPLELPEPPEPVGSVEGLLNRRLEDADDSVTAALRAAAASGTEPVRSALIQILEDAHPLAEPSGEEE